MPGRSDANIYDRILDGYEAFPPIQKRIADYVISHIHEVVFYSITELATAAKTSETTLVRFARNLGCAGFPELKQELVQYYREFMTIEGRIKRSIQKIPQGSLTYESIMAKEIEFLKETIRNIDDESFTRAVAAICRASMIYVFGNDLNIAVANDLCYRLSHFKLRAFPQSISDRGVYEKLLLINGHDLAIIFDFYKPSVDFTRLTDILKKKKVPILLITDTVVPPMIKAARVVLCAKRDSNDSMYYSQVVPMAVSNALVIGVANQLGEKAAEALRELSEFRRNFNLNEMEEFSL